MSELKSKTMKQMIQAQPALLVPLVGRIVASLKFPCDGHSGTYRAISLIENTGAYYLTGLVASFVAKFDIDVSRGVTPRFFWGIMCVALLLGFCLEWLLIRHYPSHKLGWDECKNDFPLFLWTSLQAIGFLVLGVFSGILVF